MSPMVLSPLMLGFDLIMRGHHHHCYHNCILFVLLFRVAVPLLISIKNFNAAATITFDLYPAIIITATTITITLT